MTRNFQLVIANLGALPAEVRGRVRKSLAASMQVASGVAQRDYLSGPRPGRLDVVTTRLRQSIQPFVQDNGTEIIAGLGTVVPYAARHEYGATGTEEVRAHTRRIGVKAGGRLLRNQDINRIKARAAAGDKPSKKALRGLDPLNTVTTTVRAHTRRLNYQGKPFLGPALKDTMPNTQANIQKALTPL